MNKKVMAVAVAGALAVPGMALAQTSTVQIGGSLNWLYYQHSPNNSSVGKKGDIFEPSEPELFIRGEEKLGGGLSAWFQCTSSLDGMVGGEAGAEGLCARNSALGFRGNFGNVFFGNWDLPQKLVVNQVRGWFSGTNALWGGSARLLDGGSSSGLSNPSQVTTGSAGNGTFYRRQARSLHYHSPSWNGFQVQGAYSSATETTGIPEANPLKPRLYSLAAHYTSGPLWVGFAYESHSDYNPASHVAASYIGGDDEQWTIGVRYTFQNRLRLSARYADSEFEAGSAGANVGQMIDVKGWSIHADWNIQGPHSIKAQYATSESGGNSTKSVGRFVSDVQAAGAGTSADLWTLAYTYDFSKRTRAVVAYNKMSNDMGIAQGLGKTTATMGGNQKSFGLGLQHRF